MTAQFPPLPDAAPRADLAPRAAQLPDWPRLMSERLAASYLSIGTTTLRERGPKPKKVGGRTLWDRRDLDRFADALDGQQLDQGEAESHSRDVERAWRDKRTKEGRGNG